MPESRRASCTAPGDSLEIHLWSARGGGQPRSSHKLVTENISSPQCSNSPQSSRSCIGYHGGTGLQNIITYTKCCSIGCLIASYAYFYILAHCRWLVTLSMVFTLDVSQLGTQLTPFSGQDKSEKMHLGKWNTSYTDVMLPGGQFLCPLVSSGLSSPLQVSNMKHFDNVGNNVQ